MAISKKQSRDPLCIRATALAACISMIGFASIGSNIELTSEVIDPEQFVVNIGEISNQGDEPYKRSGRVLKSPSGAWEEHRAAIEKYPSAVECLEKGSVNGNAVDLARIDWSSLSGRNALSVCIFRMVTSLDDPEKVVNWLKLHDFRVTIFTHSGDESSEIDYSLEQLAAITGSWSNEDFRKRRPSILYTLFGFDLVRYATVNIGYDEKGKLLGAGFSQNAY